MSRIWAVIKRECGEFVRSKTFVIGTLFGPFLIMAFFALQIYMFRSAGGERSLAIIDQTNAGVGTLVKGAIGLSLDPTEVDDTRFSVEIVTPAAADFEAVRGRLNDRVAAGQLDGYLVLPADLLSGGSARYEGRNATNRMDVTRVRLSVQRSVQALRLTGAGIDARAVAEALTLVPFEARKTGTKAASGTPQSAIMLAYMLGFSIYLVIALYGVAVLRGVLEEKRDRIVEVVVSSIKSEQLMYGKVLGIGAAGLLQVLVWAIFAGVALSKGDRIAGWFGTRLPELPNVPLSLGVVFVVFFVGGFFLYSGIYAALGSIATTDQEAQQMQFPVVFMLIIAMMMMGPVMNDPDGRVATIASFVPFTSSIVMPMRAVVAEVPMVHLVASAALLAATGIGVLWVGSKIYRIGILATGKRATPTEVWGWLRSN